MQTSKAVQQVHEAVANKPTDPEAYKAAKKVALLNRNKVFSWDKEKLRAARLIADGRKTIAAIAALCEVKPGTIGTWKKNETFMAKVEKCREAWKARTLETGIAVKEYRLRTLDKLDKGLGEIIESRKEYFARKHSKLPGVHTGLVVETFKFRNRKDGSQQKIIETQVDTGLINAIRSVNNDAAKELNQLRENVNVEQTTIIREYDGDTSQV